MIVVTGAVGFIGSQLIEKLNNENFNDIVAVDKFDREDKNKNIVGLKIKEKIGFFRAKKAGNSGKISGRFNHPC